MEDIRKDTHRQLARARLAPAAAPMMIDSKVPSRWYTVTSIYKPTQEPHAANDKPLLRIYKTTTGMSRYAKTQAIWAPQKDSGMGLMRADARHAMAVQRECIRQYGSSKPYFREGLIEYMKDIHDQFGGCPAVLLPHSRDVQAGTHVWTCLQHVVSQVGLPMWLPGSCHKASHIILRHKDKAG